MSAHKIWTAEQGGSVDLNCSLSEDPFSHFDIEWYFTNKENKTSLIALQQKDHQTIKTNKERTRVLGNGLNFVSLQIADLQVQDTGKYTAKIKTIVENLPSFKTCTHNLLVNQSHGTGSLVNPDPSVMQLALGLSLGLLIVLVLLLVLFFAVRCYRYKYLLSSTIQIEPTSTTSRNTTIFRLPSRQPSHYRPGAPFPHPPTPPPPPPTGTCSPPADESPTSTPTTPSEAACSITLPPNTPPQYAKPFRPTAALEPPVSEDTCQDVEQQEEAEYLNGLIPESDLDVYQNSNLQPDINFDQYPYL
uniref:uncharacterized protein n=1 Tax=Myxine glutinosa TaxID=7769 RepID=UPI0035900038